MSALKEFANFILLNVANLAATYDRLLAENGGDYLTLPADSRLTAARRLIKTVAEACEAETPDPLHHLFEARIHTLSIESNRSKLPQPLAEVECLDQTLTPVVTNLEAGKFLWQMLSDIRHFLWQNLPEVLPSSGPNAEAAVGSLSLEDKTRFLYYMVENSQVAQVALDEQARIQYINPFFCSLYGYQAQEVIGQHVSILSGEDEPEAHYLNLLELAARHNAWHGEDWRKRKDGSIFPASVTFSGIRNEKGVLIAYLDVSRDVTERRNVQDQLRQLSQVAEQSPTIVIITNIAGQIEYVNPKFCQITGYTPVEVIGQNPNILKSGETSSKEYKQMWQSISSGQEWWGELHNKKKNGELYWVSSHISPIKDPAGNVTHYLAIQEDITERKQTEDQLRKLSRAVEQSVSTVVITNTDGYIEYVNPKFTQTTGYTREEAIGQHTRILKSGITTPGEYKKLWETISAGAEWQGEFCNKKKNGDLYWEYASISPIKDERGEITHFLAVKEDITYRKQTEATLAQERYLLRTLIDNIPDYIYAKDSQGRFILGNLAVAQVMGAATPNDLIGKTDFDFYPPEVATPYYADDLEIIRSGQSLLNKEERVLDPTGQMIWALTTKIALRDDQGQIIGLVGIGREITNYKHLELQLQGSLARLTRQIQAITEVAQQISGTLTLDDLFHQVVELMETQFGYYHAQIYTMVEGDMVLQAGAGEIGRRLKEKDHKIPLSVEQSLVIRAVWEGESVWVPDVSQEPTWLPNPLLPETKAELAVPITLGAEVLGVLDVQSDKLGELNEEDRLLLIGLCGQIAIAIETRRTETERARLLAEAERRARREQIIREITEKMRAANNLEQLVKITARELGQRLSAGHAVVELGIEAETQPSLPIQNLSNNGH